MNDWKLVIGDKQLSSWSLRPWLALKMAGLPFEEVPIKLDTPEFHAQIGRYSANSRVPALITDSVRISESLAIAEYAAEFAPTLWPKDREVRAIARAVSHEMHAGFATLRKSMPMQFSSTGLPHPSSEALEADIRRILTLWGELRDRFSGAGPFLFGAFSIADAMYAPVVSRFRTYGVGLDPVTQAYAETVWALAPMQEWLSGAKRELSL